VVRRVALALVLAALGAGAGTGCEDKQLAQLEAVRADVCACKSPLCAELAMRKLPKDDIRSDHRTQQLARDMMDCVSKIEEAATAKANEDPDAGSGGGIEGSGIRDQGSGSD
jgi:hypothetical protein